VESELAADEAVNKLHLKTSKKNLSRIVEEIHKNKRTTFQEEEQKNKICIRRREF
jgi:hypothetical protein